MKKIIPLCVVVLIFACNNSSKTKNREHVPINSIDKIDNEKKVANRNTDRNIYSWSEKEQNKFMTDCTREFKESVAEGKIKEICNCILTQARQYYKSYSQMEEKSNDDHDGEIITKCLGGYDEDEE